MSKRRRGYPSETQVKRGIRIVHGDKLLEEKLGTVEKKAVQGDEKMKRAMRQLRDKSKTIRNARADRSGFVAAMAASNAMAYLDHYRASCH